MSEKRPISELINTEEPGWALVTEWMRDATHMVEVLPVDEQAARDTLYEIQVTSRSPMGAIILNTGGILVDHGWIRILGSGCPRMNRSIYTWNQGKSMFPDGSAGFLLIADDAAGGFFATNGGGLGEDIGKTYYLDPASLYWEPLGVTYSEFLNFCFSGDLQGYYQDLRWKGWEEDAAKLDGNQVYNFYPTLWTREGKNINEISRKAIAVQEQYELNEDFIRQLGNQ